MKTNSGGLKKDNKEILIYNWPLIGHLHPSDYLQDGNFNSNMPGCVCQKLKNMGPFFASSECKTFKPKLPLNIGMNYEQNPFIIL